MTMSWTTLLPFPPLSSPPSLSPLNDMQSSALTSGSVVSSWLSDSLPWPVFLCLQWSCSWDCRMWSNDIMHAYYIACTIYLYSNALRCQLEHSSETEKTGMCEATYNLIQDSSWRHSTDWYIIDRITWPWHEPYYSCDKHSRWSSPVIATSVFAVSGWL